MDRDGLSEASHRFVEELGHSGDIWRTLDLRLMALRVEDEWHNLQTRIYLQEDSAEDVPSFPLPDGIPGLLVKQVVLPLSQLEAILVGLEEGRLDLAGQSILYQDVTHGTDLECKPYGSDYYFLDLTSRHQQLYRGWAAHVLHGMGSGTNHFVSQASADWTELNDRIRSSDTPYDGLSGLAYHYLGSPRSFGPNEYARYYLLAPLRIQIDVDGTRLERGDLIICVTGTSEGTFEKAALSVFGQDGTLVPWSRKLRLDKAEYEVDEGVWKSRLTVQHAGLFDATIMLVVGHRCVHSYSVVDDATVHHNERARAYEIAVADRDLDIFRNWLRVSSDGNRFEHAVSRLLYFCGFAVDSFAQQGRLDDAVDFLAFHDSSRHILAVECTLGTPDSRGKLGRLAVRAGELAKAIPTFSVTPVLATRLEREDVPTKEREKAAADGIVLLCGDDLNNLYTQVASKGAGSMALRNILSCGEDPTTLGMDWAVERPV